MPTTILSTASSCNVIPPTKNALLSCNLEIWNATTDSESILIDHEEDGDPTSESKKY